MVKITASGGQRRVIQGLSFKQDGTTVPLCPKCKGERATLDGDTLTCLACGKKWQPLTEDTGK